MKISLIAAVDNNNGLGKNNQLLCHLPADLQHFKKITMGKPIVMGRKTFESIGRPLPGRLNIVLSRQHVASTNPVYVLSISKAIELAGDVPEIMIIGGMDIFKQTMAIATDIYLTKIHHCFDADVFFPVIDEKKWMCDSEEYRAPDVNNPYGLSFLHFLCR